MSGLLWTAACVQVGEVTGELEGPGDDEADAAPLAPQADAAPGSPDATPAEAADATPAETADAGPDVPPTFTANVYPILQFGGAGCANCHASSGVASFLIMNDGEQAVYDRLKARPGVIDLANPPASLLLTKPLKEQPPNHPVGLFADTSDPQYVTILTWIQDGAPL